MLGIISNASSIITCLLFVLYIIGHIWKESVMSKARYEKFTVLPCDFDHDISDNDNVVIVDKVGSEFVITSTFGIRKISFYRVEFEINEDGSKTLISKKLLKTSDNLNFNEPVCVKCELGELLPTTQIEVERIDYVKATFELFISGKDGHLMVTDTVIKNTWKSKLYYLCI